MGHTWTSSLTHWLSIGWPIIHVCSPRSGSDNRPKSSKPTGTVWPVFYLDTPMLYPKTAASKWKHGMKLMYVILSINGEDEEDRDAVCGHLCCLWPDTNTYCQLRHKTKASVIIPAMKERMKKVFNEVHKAVLTCKDTDGWKHCELFHELPDRRVCDFSFQSQDT